jgi:thioredoxin-like negative regulator of GroEL
MLERLVIAVGLALAGMGGFTMFRYAHLRRASQATTSRGKPVLLYFWSESCAPCATQAHYLEQLGAEFGDRIVIEKVDADQHLSLAERYGVFTLPTTLVVDGAGTVKHANYGLTDARRLANQLTALA